MRLDSVSDGMREQCITSLKIIQYSTWPQNAGGWDTSLYITVLSYTEKKMCCPAFMRFVTYFCTYLVFPWPANLDTTEKKIETAALICLWHKLFCRHQEVGNYLKTTEGIFWLVRLIQIPIRLKHFDNITICDHLYCLHFLSKFIWYSILGHTGKKSAIGRGWFFCVWENTTKDRIFCYI